MCFCHFSVAKSVQMYGSCLPRLTCCKSSSVKYHGVQSTAQNKCSPRKACFSQMKYCFLKRNDQISSGINTDNWKFSCRRITFTHAPNQSSIYTIELLYKSPVLLQEGYLDDRMTCCSDDGMFFNATDECNIDIL